MRVVIGEDEALMRQGLSMVMAAGGLTVDGVAPDAPTLVRLVEEHEPDLVISDIRMPPTGTDDGLRAVIRLRRSRPGLPVIVLSHHVQRQYAAELLAAGPTGVGYLLKHRVADIDAFVDQVRRVHDGGTVLDPEVVATMVERARRTTRPIDALSPRQREVLALVAEGRSNAAIGRRLNITERTVVQHVSVVYDRLGIVETDDDHRRVLAVLAFLTE